MKVSASDSEPTTAGIHHSGKHSERYDRTETSPGSEQINLRMRARKRRQRNAPDRASQFASQVNGRRTVDPRERMLGLPTCAAVGRNHTISLRFAAHVKR